MARAMLSAAVLVMLLTSPTLIKLNLPLIRSKYNGQGVLLVIVKNYTGDILNFEMAKEIAEMNDIAVGDRRSG